MTSWSRGARETEEHIRVANIVLHDLGLRMPISRIKQVARAYEQHCATAGLAKTFAEYFRTELTRDATACSEAMSSTLCYSDRTGEVATNRAYRAAQQRPGAA
ncbi:hypothetical protein OEM_20240 [Mycobacterium intracellulare subsp. yongonense 05-1390]|uniref:hypothetical protein n=1 Tax=Mycobacterium TaxID=1763 RepID=UPI00025D5759|nr:MULTISPECIES: hypothetical protein [Mycobacterium]AFJ35074.1 hypothetical protein W7S_10515 [Mycobacterium sp. MOTT36Y]AGP63559.1 hypothetical protein OEM_20240 [Mycobacterium intracellulare subsp. yongonense 05-1390]ELR84817.1 hypothetical protein W7U_06285 [Mycobacterium sp. H4Y]PBA55298.1 hypothetical protein CKJ57_11605 [Mycobacterium intracellulare subsp. chimaera]